MNKFDGKSSKYDGFVICDVCGRKIRRSKAVRITDSFNTLCGLLVCKQDADRTNPQNYPDFPWKESIVNPLYVRSEPDPTYVMITTSDEIENGDTVDVGGILPDAPRYLRLITNDTTSVTLGFMSPISCGSRGLLGWKVQRESPVGGGFSTLTSNTNSIDLTYTDATTIAGQVYNYRIAAVTRAGTGPYSDAFVVNT